MNLGKHILLAEDDEADIDLAKMALEEQGVQAGGLAVARDGSEALDYLFRRGSYQQRTSGNPDLMILDLKLPKIDGLEVLRMVRADAATKNLQVVVFTSSLLETDRDEALKYGADAFVVKPLELDDYCDSICAMLNFCNSK